MDNRNEPTNPFFSFHDLQIGFVTQGIDFCPVNGYTSTRLDVAEQVGGLLFLRVRFVNEDHLFSLIEVGDIPVLIYTTTEISCSGPVSGTAADKIQEDVDVLDHLPPNFES
jgi:hypothetical protein